MIDQARYSHRDFPSGSRHTFYQESLKIMEGNHQWSSRRKIISSLSDPFKDDAELHHNLTGLTSDLTPKKWKFQSFL